MTSTQSGSLKSYLRSQYGGQTQKTVDLLGKELERVARFKNHHHFNFRCYKSGIVPPSLRVKSPVNTERSIAAALHVSRIFTQERIKTSWRAWNDASSCVKECRDRLRNILSDDDFSRIDTLCTRTGEATFQKARQRQVRKFDKMKVQRLSPSNDKELNLRPSWIINLSERKLSGAERSVLSKGPKFATAPKINAIDIAAPIEAALKLSAATDQVKEMARVKICEAISKAKKPADNLNKEERKAARKLRNDKEIKILHADKGNATVVMNTIDYDKKAHDLLDNKESYAVLSKDPTRTTERNLLTLLRNLRREKKIDEAFYNSVRPSEGSSKPALFYGRVKIHKRDVPLRPVIATCGTSTYKLAQRLSFILRPLTGSSGRILRNTEDLISIFDEVVIEEDEMLVSYDVKSLFTSIPVEESIKICERRLQSDDTLAERTSLSVPTIITLLKFCLTTTAFQFNGTVYKQLDGVAMGLPISPVIADIFMEHFEDSTFKNYPLPPRIWHRFVDDVIAVVRKKSSQSLLDHLNDQHARIKFTMEEENGGSLPFMDVRFSRQLRGEITREVYQKPTHTNRYVQFNSHHPNAVKAGVVECLAKRAILVSSTQKLRDLELKRIRKVMAENGYPRKFVEKAISKQLKRHATGRKLPQQDEKNIITTTIPFVDGLSQEVRRVARMAGVRCAFFAPNTLTHMYSAKDALLTDSTTHSVYSVRCKTCTEEYIGETQRSLSVRRKEHQDATRLGQCPKSAVAEHVHSQLEEIHEIDWSTMKVIDRARRTTERRVREALHIHKRKPQINRDNGIERSACWNAFV